MLRGFSDRVRAALASAAEIGTLPPADHRPWPLPSDPWIMMQTWRDLLFAHWPLRPDEVSPLIPRGLSLDTFDGRAWLGIVPFTITGLRMRGTPGIPGVSNFPEINVRTYVHTGGKPGVLFFSLDAGSALAVAAARALYRLPYFRAEFRIATHGDEVSYGVRRTHAEAPPAICELTYGPRDRLLGSDTDALSLWLTERYCLYSFDRSGKVYRAEIHHPRWPLQPAEAEFRVNDMTRGPGLRLPDTLPLLHFAKRLDVHVWALHPVEA
jgi:uncharacterized protein YqjF (DUF2071 family)